MAHGIVTVDEFFLLLEPVDVLQEESERVVPRQENVLDDVFDAFLLESGIEENGKI